MLTCLDSVFYYTRALRHVGLKENCLGTLKCFLDQDFFFLLYFINACLLYFFKRSTVEDSVAIWIYMPFSFINAIKLLLLMGSY